MTRLSRFLHRPTVALFGAASRLVFAVTLVALAFLGLILLVVPAIAAFAAIEWARARRWVRAR